VRTKGLTKQTKESRRQAALFGLASSLSARLRKALAPVTGIPTDRALVYRLNNAFRTWLNGSTANSKGDNTPSLEGFNFTRKPLDSCFEGRVLVHRKHGEFLLDIPPFATSGKLSAEGTGVVTLITVSCLLANKEDTRIYEMRLDMPDNGPQQVGLPMESCENCITILLMSVNRQATAILAVMQE